MLSDALSFGEMALPLSAGWWRQLGDESKAQTTEAMVQNVTTAPVPEPGKRRRRSDTYDVKEIVEQKGDWFLVRWDGYHPSWEAWRISGNVGSPLETWEPRRTLKRTEALRVWSG